MPKTPHATKAATPKKTATVQLVCRIDPALNEHVRAHADRAGQTLTMFVARALAKATVVKPPAGKSDSRRRGVGDRPRGRPRE